LVLALASSGCDSATVLHKPRLLSDNGPSYIAGELAEYIEANKMSHVRGAPMHPQTQGCGKRKSGGKSSKDHAPSEAHSRALVTSRFAFFGQPFRQHARICVQGDCLVVVPMVATRGAA